MLRRNTSAPQLQLCLLSATASPATSSLKTTTAVTTARRSFFGSLGKQWGSGSGAAAGASDASSRGTAAAADGATSGVPPSGMPPGFDLQKLQTMQQLFQSQSKERQEQFMKQAMEMQKMMSKIPGFGKLTQTNTAMLEQLMKMQQQQPQPQSSPGSAASSAAPSGATGTSAPQPSSPRRDLFSGAVNSKGSGSTGNGTSGGPSLDELKKVNLGPEIEALFQELRTMRSRKNEYRDKCTTAQAALDALQREHVELTSREASLRGRLTKAEQEVMLLTSENMELRESSKAVKQLTQANRQLKAEVEQLRAAAQSSAAPGTATYAALQQQLHDRDDALRSLQRKVDRMRRRDPLLQFSLACSNVSRLSAGHRGDDAAAGSNGHGGDAAGVGSSNSSAAASSGATSVSPHSAASALAAVVAEASQETADTAFAELQRAYLARQQAAWMAAAHEHGAAAVAFLAVVRRYVLMCVPFANYDAVVTFTGDSAALRACLADAGFQVEFVDGASGGRAHVTAAPDAPPCTASPGPFGYAVALRLATAGAAGGASPTTPGTSASTLPFTITNAQPYVSAALVSNAQRSRVEYETARASGPGGQATNVTETQVYARLYIDGVAAFTAEAQDSRSALSNREAALEKLQQQRRLQYNEAIARQARAEAVQAQLVASLRAQGGFSAEESVMDLVQEAAAAKAVTMADAALATMLQVLGRTAGAA